MNQQVVGAMLEELRRERHALTVRLEELEMVEGRLAAWTATPTARVEANTLPASFPPGTTQARATETILREQGRPCRVPELVDMMLARGVEIGGPVATRRRRLADCVAALMRKRPSRFRRVGSGLWDLTPSHQKATDEVADGGGAMERQAVRANDEEDGVDGSS